METIYAKTLNPENYDFRVYEDAYTENDDIIVDGGRNLVGINDDLLKTIKNLTNDFESWDYERCLKLYYNNSIVAYFKDALKINTLSKYQASLIKKALQSENLSQIRITCLSIIKGKPYKSCVLRGCCQGDVVCMYCPEDTDQKFIDDFESWYFGTGTEIEIHEGDNEVTDADQIEGYTFYTSSWKIEDIKREIIENVYGNKTDVDVKVKLWTYDKTQVIRIDKYKLADE